MILSLRDNYVTDINNNYKIPTGYKVHKPVVHLDRTANFDNQHNWGLMEVDTADNLVDNRPDHHIVHLETVVVIDKDRSGRYCIGMKTANPRMVKVVHSTGRFSFLEAKNRCNESVR